MKKIFPSLWNVFISPNNKKAAEKPLTSDLTANLSQSWEINCCSRIETGESDIWRNIFSPVSHPAFTFRSRNYSGQDTNREDSPIRRNIVRD
ncbi:hypothetical protein CDAR_536671 [Caerostris darwini]|uniref:Ycf15 n=1 Tax=Caerostris darwini TaxID=1538125 RepID=A0AAV4VI31_9ARAC|nr:hypothetical protein CDAR_536671 [Caerostris darwini]